MCLLQNEERRHKASPLQVPADPIGQLERGFGKVCRDALILTKPYLELNLVKYAAY